MEGLLFSFDFDDTLQRRRWDQEEFEFIVIGPDMDLIRILKAHNSVIVTSRLQNASYNDGLREFLKKYNINVPVHFTNGKPKVHTLLTLGVDVHFDDDPDEIDALEGTDIKGILVDPPPGLLPGVR